MSHDDTANLQYVVIIHDENPSACSQARSRNRQAHPLVFGLLSPLQQTAQGAMGISPSATSKGSATSTVPNVDRVRGSSEASRRLPSWPDQLTSGTRNVG